MRNAMDNRQQQIQSLGITHICFLGDYDLDLGENDCNTYSHLLAERREGTLYCVVSKRFNCLSFTMKWPASYLEVTGGQDCVDCFGLTIQTSPHLVKLTRMLFHEITTLENESRQEVEECVRVIEQHVQGILQEEEARKKEAAERKAIEIQRAQDTIRYLFNLEEEQRIERFFDVWMLRDIKTLKTLLCPNDQWDAVNGSKDALKFAKLVTALKAMPHHKMTPEDASQDEKVKEIVEAAAELREWLKLDESIYNEDHYNQIRRFRRYNLIVNILGAILLVAPTALVGFKAGAAWGAVVGGGVASVPSAMIGGCVGALVGGGLGLFGGGYAVQKIAHKCAAPPVGEHLALCSAFIDMAVQDVLPPPSSREGLTGSNLRKRSQSCLADNL